MKQKKSNHEISHQPQVTGNEAMYTRVAKQLYQNAKAQTADLLSFAQQLGFTNEQISMCDQDTSDVKEVQQ